MNSEDEEALSRFLLQPSEGYAQLYPSILPRLRQAYENGNPLARQAVMAMAMALSRAHGARERRLRDEYNLTPTEIRVAFHIGGGGTVASCAEALGVAESTVRSHLKALFTKTGVRRQAELQRLL
jgi:DNA-binding CsgD family transcriptional regulator